MNLLRDRATGQAWPPGGFGYVEISLPSKPKLKQIFDECGLLWIFKIVLSPLSGKENRVVNSPDPFPGPKLPRHQIISVPKGPSCLKSSHDQRKSTEQDKETPEVEAPCSDAGRRGCCLDQGGGNRERNEGASFPLPETLLPLCHPRLTCLVLRFLHR